jgi:signal transduction histidine kinase
VYIIGETGVMERKWVKHRDPGMKHFVDDYLGRDPASNVLTDMSSSLVAGQSLFRARVDVQYLKELARDPGHLKALRKLDVGSLLVVPLIAHRYAVGAMTLARCGNDCVPFTNSDLRLAEELGRRAGLAIEHARLAEQHQRQNDFLKRMIGIVAHDLRNPLGNILMALESSGELQPEAAGRVREAALNSGHRMARLIQDLQDAARVYSGQTLSIEQQVEPVSPIIEEAIEAVRLELYARTSASNPALRARCRLCLPIADGLSRRSSTYLETL